MAYLLEPSTTVPPGPIFMFVDNRQAIRVAMGRLSPPWCVSEAKAIRGSIRRLATGRRLYIYWVPGHAGVPGNDLADVLAKLGAAGVDFSGASAPDSTRPPPEEPPGRRRAGKFACTVRRWCRRPSIPGKSGGSGGRGRGRVPVSHIAITPGQLRRHSGGVNRS